ncbi:uncharacterized protein LOC125314254 [Rhodamnia argentea]|uniref:Uncharacterized protein LOC125314254 n=1 Tax=Rhodamnia argentea TaxID=178133 RepID=A0ABM3H681_9MYRT|nr:uncharacterized protein LOC125314254 [Rhodamnia argentea]
MSLQAAQTTPPREAPELSSAAYTMRSKLEEEEEGEPENVWDCGSPLYDSYELASLGHLLDRNMMALSVSWPESQLSSPSKCHDSGSPVKAEASCKQRSSAKSSGKKVARMFRSGFSAFVRSVMKNN